MRIQIDLEITPRAKKAITWIALPFAVLVGSAFVAHASWPSGDPALWMTSGSPISASKLLGLFNDADKRLGALEAAPAAVPVGTIVAYGAVIDGTHPPPNGWLLCDGTQYNGLDVKYANLYAALGTAFGGNKASQSFNVPDLRGRFLRGVDGGVGRDPDRGSRQAMTSGGNVGDNVGSVQGDAFASHSHTQTWQYYQWGDANASGVSRNSGNPAPAYPGPRTDGAGGSETRPVNASANFIIRY